ncbi:MAG: TetR family transcriptional regulator [Synergistaceae bacterium]|nr:TetR family transcriptional regulator [Synergistaceae bacterium]
MARKSREEASGTREKILDSALAMMNERPFSRVSISGIAGKIGLSKGAVYWHFKNKNDLLVSLVESMCARIEEDLDAAGEPGSLAEIRNYFVSKMEVAVKSGRVKNMCRLMIRRYEWPEAVREKVRVIVQDRIELERAMLERFLVGNRRKEDPGAPPPAELAALVSTVMHGLFASHLVDICSVDLVKYVDFILRALIQGPYDIK